MTASTATAPVDHFHGHDPHLSAVGVLRSEWIKLRTVRSTVWCYALIVLLMVGIGALAASLVGVQGATAAGDASRNLVVQVQNGGLNLSVLIVAVLGTLIITGEYSTGMIRSTFTAAPKRLPAIAAKAAILTVTAFITALVAVWLTALVTWPILDHRGVPVDFADSRVFMPMLGGAVFVALIGLLAYGIGIILRSTAGGLATVLGLLLVAPGIVGLLGALTHLDWLQTVMNVLPNSAGGQLASYAMPGSKSGIVDGVLMLNGWLGFWVLLGWDVIVLAAAVVLVKRRDA